MNILKQHPPIERQYDYHTTVATTRCRISYMSNELDLWRMLAGLGQADLEPLRFEALVDLKTAQRKS